MNDTSFVRISIDQLTESPFNPRRRFNEAGLQELAIDIREVGVQQPLLVRPRWSNVLHVGITPPDGHEIVFGHRRFRGAKLAGLVDVPCMVRTMTDAEARRVQISENLQREDVHPIEEAEGFQALMSDPDEPISADALAEQLGKSRSYVYGRLKLLQACNEVREACLEGEIGSEVALLVARLRTDKLQARALAYIKNNYSSSFTDGGKSSFRSIRNLLNEKFSLELKRAIFPIEDASLVAEAGSCIECPKRSGNAPEFDDIANPDPVKDRRGMRTDYVPHCGADICTDPDCFDVKKKAHLKREASALEAKGKVVVDGNKARAAISADGKIKGAYVALKDVRAELKAYAKAPMHSMAGVPIEVQTVTIQDPRTGKTVEAVKLAELKEAGILKEAPRPKASSGGDPHADHRKREERAKAATEANTRLLHKVRIAMTGAALGLEDLRMVAQFAFDGVYSSDGTETLEALLGMPARKIQAQLPAMQAAELTRLLVDCALVVGVQISAWDTPNAPDQLVAAAERYGIDAEATLAGDEPASTPSTAARAPKKAAAGAKRAVKKAAPAKAKKGPIKPFDASAPVEPELVGNEVIDDDGSAVERDPNTDDMFEAAGVGA